MAIVRPRNVLGPNIDDPLGTNLKQRGMDSYYAEARKSDPRYASGPLPDPAWEGLFQAMQDQGVSKVGMDTGRPNGLADDPTRGADSALAETGSAIPQQPLMASTNIAGGQPVSRRSLALEGLEAALPESHTAFMSRLAKKFGPR